MDPKRLPVLIPVIVVFGITSLLFSCDDPVGSENPPTKPSNPSPVNGATNVSVDTAFSWECSDPDIGDILVYHMYIRNDEKELELDVDFIDQPSVYLGPLEYGATYTWSVWVKDEGGHTVHSDVWSFTTEEYTGNGPFLWSFGTCAASSSQTNYACKINPETGGIIQYFDTDLSTLAGSGGEGRSYWSMYDGMTWDGQHIWYTYYYGGFIRCVNPEDGSEIRKFDSPGDKPTGLAWDGTSLWNADEGTAKIYRLDPSNGAVLSYIDAPCTNPDGLTWDGTNLWCSGRYPDSYGLFCINPVNGEVIGTYDIDDTRDNALTFDGVNLWGADSNLSAAWITKFDTTSSVISTINSPFLNGDISGLAWQPADK